MIRTAVTSLIVFTVLLGVAYPVALGVAALAIPHPAPSELVGQAFESPAYFWSRPSATGYDALPSSGTNLGPSDARFVAAVKARIAALNAADPRNTAPVPIDLVTASASGLDPHISPAAAYYQVARVARVRGIAATDVTELVDANVEERTFGFLGERRVNVRRLNLALDATKPPPGRRE